MSKKHGKILLALSYGLNEEQIVSLGIASNAQLIREAAKQAYKSDHRNSQRSRFDIERLQQLLKEDYTVASIIEAMGDPRVEYYIYQLQNLATYPNYGQPWSVDQDATLKQLYQSGETIPNICKALGRNPRGVTARLELLGFMPNEKEPLIEDQTTQGITRRSAPIDRSPISTPTIGKSNDQSTSEKPPPRLTPKQQKERTQQIRRLEKKVRKTPYRPKSRITSDEMVRAEAASRVPIGFCWGPGCEGLVPNMAGAVCPICNRAQFGPDFRQRFDNRTNPDSVDI